MTRSHPTITDELIRQALTELSAGPDAGQLQDEVLRAVDVMPQARTSWLGFGSRRTALVLVAAALLMAALASVVALGSLVLRTTDFNLAYELDGDIFVADWDGKNPVRIADGPPDDAPGCENVLGPTWSPDGRYFAYRSGSFYCPSATVVISDPAGHIVASLPGVGWDIAWSPDSTRVATWIDVDRTIGIYGLDGIREALLTLPAGYGTYRDEDPIWSPDGESVLISLRPAPGGDPRQTWELPLDGRTPQPVPSEDPRSHYSHVAYSPDGARVAYFEEESLVVAAADGSHAATLITDGMVVGGPVQSPVWCPTGDRIAVAPGVEAGTPFGPMTDLALIDVATRVVTSLATGGGTHTLAAIGCSPEGDRILFSRTDANGEGSLWSANADGSGAQLLVAGTSSGDWQWPP